MKKYRGALLIALDVFAVVVAYIVAIIIRYDFRYTQALAHEGFLGRLPLVAIVYFVVFFITKTYKSVWERVSLEEGFRIVLANLISSSIVTLMTYFESPRSIPASVIVIAFLLNTLFQESARFSYRLYRYKRVKDHKNRQKKYKRVLIYGAGNSGAFVAKEMTANSDYEYYVVGFIDDNPDLRGAYISGHIVFGGKSMIEKVIDQHVVDEIIVAMPNQSKQTQKEIETLAFKLGLPVKSVSSSNILFDEPNLKKSLKEVDILDLLQRKEIVINDNEVRNSIEGKNVLVTGAAGSIGSELVRQITKFSPTKVVLVDLNENAMYGLQQELEATNKIDHIEMHYLIASIRDKFRLDQIFKEHNIDLVFHAAAHKHVPLMENSPKEAIKNNILGTKNLIDLAKKYEVQKFVNISTDKAVNPTNVMGATKRFNEMLLQSQNGNCKTKFMAVRFGNVLGSNGSVVPFFKKQIAAGGPVTVTHKDITRYFMTIPEAVSLVLLAETYAKGGEIFVLNMGEPVKILDLAEQMISLSGFKPYEDIDITFTGLRPGEKLYEELLMDEEGLTKTDNELIFIAHPVVTPMEELLEHISRFEEILKLEVSREEIYESIKKAVPTFLEDKRY